jgi:hypothetical protein
MAFLLSVAVYVKAHFVMYEHPSVVQAVSRRLPTTAARVQAQVRSCGICGGQSGAGAGFLLLLRFPLPILIPPTAPQSPPSIGAGTIGQLVADVPSVLKSPSAAFVKTMKMQETLARTWKISFPWIVVNLNKPDMKSAVLVLRPGTPRSRPGAGWLPAVSFCSAQRQSSDRHRSSTDTVE